MMMINVELHCHTYRSSDSLMTIAQLIKACETRQIHKVAITDHNTIQAAREAFQLDPQRFIIGEEIMTRQGELLAYYIQEEIPSGLDAEDVLQELHAQKAIISVSHPFDRFRKGHWQESDLLKIIDQIDAIESFNARCLVNEDNMRAARFAAEHHLLETVGSDAHAAVEVGKSYLSMPDFFDANSFRNGLKNAQQHNQISSPLVHLFSQYAKWKKRLT
ncbi:MAG: PHP-associated domain-containing protein [Anaerolineales bacterium]